MSRPARVIVDLSALRTNFKVVKERAPNARVMAIVKADGYGHGIARVATALAAQADAFGVASLEEALRLREAGIANPIVLLEGLFSALELSDIDAHRLELVVHSNEQLELLRGADKPLTLWVKVDSGMHRLGFAPSEIESVVSQLASNGHSIRFMSHLANAQLDDDGSVERQLGVFDRALGSLPGERSIANSGAILAWPATHQDWIRPGLMLYGVSPFAGQDGRGHGLQPAMTVASEIIAIRTVAAGETIGYGNSYVAPAPMSVGVVAFGYGDGYPRHARTGTPVSVKGIRTQVVGEASMDMLTVDLRPISDPQVGDPVVLWGPDLPVEEIATRAETIPYELLCRVGLRARYVAVE